MSAPPARGHRFICAGRLQTAATIGSTSTTAGAMSKSWPIAAPDRSRPLSGSTCPRTQPAARPIGQRARSPACRAILGPLPSFSNGRRWQGPRDSQPASICRKREASSPSVQGPWPTTPFPWKSIPAWSTPSSGWKRRACGLWRRMARSIRCKPPMIRPSLLTTCRMPTRSTPTARRIFNRSRSAASCSMCSGAASACASWTTRPTTPTMCGRIARS